LYRLYYSNISSVWAPGSDHYSMKEYHVNYPFRERWYNAYIERLVADGAQTEYSVSVFPKHIGTKYDSNQTLILEDIIESIVLQSATREAMNDIYKHALFGQSAGFIDIEDDESGIPIAVVKRISLGDAYFDVEAVTPSKADGRWCAVRCRKKTALFSDAAEKEAADRRDYIKFFWRTEDGRIAYCQVDSQMSNIIPHADGSIAKYYPGKRLPVIFFGFCDSGTITSANNSVLNVGRQRARQGHGCTEAMNYDAIVGSHAINGRFDVIASPLNKIFEMQLALDNAGWHLYKQIESCSHATYLITNISKEERNTIEKAMKGHKVCVNIASRSNLKAQDNLAMAMPQAQEGDDRDIKVHPLAGVEVSQQLIQTYQMARQSMLQMIGQLGHDADGGNAQSGVAIGLRQDHLRGSDKHISVAIAPSINAMCTALADIALELGVIRQDEYYIDGGQKVSYQSILQEIRAKYRVKIIPTYSSTMERSRSRMQLSECLQLMQQNPQAAHVLAQTAPEEFRDILARIARLNIDEGIIAVTEGKITADQYKQEVAKNKKPTLEDANIEATIAITQNDAWEAQVRAQEKRDKQKLEEQKEANRHAEAERRLDIEQQKISPRDS